MTSPTAVPASSVASPTSPFPDSQPAHSTSSSPLSPRMAQTPTFDYPSNFVSISAGRHRRQLSLLRPKRPYTHHDISRPYPCQVHTAQRMTTMFTAPVPQAEQATYKQANGAGPRIVSIGRPKGPREPRGRPTHLLVDTEAANSLSGANNINIVDGHATLPSPRRRRKGSLASVFQRCVGATPPPSPLVVLGFSSQLALAEPRSSPSPALTPVDAAWPSSAPATLRGPHSPLATSPSSTSLQKAAHRRTLSNKVRSLFVGLMLRRRGEYDIEDNENEDANHHDSGARDGNDESSPVPPGFGAPLRPHRSPGAASFHVTTRLSPITPTRSSSPPSRRTSHVSRDSAYSDSIRPHLVARPRTRRQHRRTGGYRNSSDESDDDADDERGPEPFGRNADGDDDVPHLKPDAEDDTSRDMSQQSTPQLSIDRPCTPFGLYPDNPAGMPMAAPTQTRSSPSPAIRPQTPMSIFSVPTTAMSIISVQRKSIDTGRRSFSMERERSASTASSPFRRSVNTERSRPSTDLTRRAIDSNSATYSFSSLARSSKPRSKSRRMSGAVAKAKALESKFSDTSDSEDEAGGESICGEMPDRPRPTSPFRRPWSSMPDLVRDQLRALAGRRGKSLELQ